MLRLDHLLALMQEMCLCKDWRYVYVFDSIFIYIYFVYYVMPKESFKYQITT